MYDDALIIVTSDHGEAIWQHNVLGHSHHVFDEMLNVPLVIKFPADMQVAPAKLDSLSSLTDIYPSICSWLDIAAPQYLDGRPLQGLFGEPIDPSRELFLRSFQRTPTLGLRSQTTKTILEPASGGMPERSNFFDLVQDPREHKPIAISPGGTGAESLTRLKALRDALEALGAGSVRNGKPTKEEKALIQQLGYAE